MTPMKATQVKLSDFSSPPMRAFHLSWVAFFVCFFGWFGIAPLTPLVRDEFHLSKAQLGNIMIASVAITVLARLFIGVLCDRFGPRRVYSGLLALGALPVAGIGLSHGYASFLVARLLIGAIGASFVVTQYHTSAMFASRVVGTANATAAGWGNLGGGVAQMVMPMIVAGFLALGLTTAQSWRLAMVVPALLMVALSIVYLKFTQDGPDGNRGASQEEPRTTLRPGKTGTFLAAARDPRVWALAVIYGACFGVELTIHNVAALYFRDRFHLSLGAAGFVAGLFGALALFARALGGIFGDRAGRRFGLRGRASFLGSMVLAEGVFLTLFSRMGSLPLAIASMVVFGLFVHMAAGATYSVVPFLNRRAVGSVAGIVGAGGNIGAVLAGFLFRGGMATERGFLWLGVAVLAAAGSSLLLRFDASEEVENEPLLSLDRGADKGLSPAE